MSSLLSNGLDTLRFFTGDGMEIQMRRQYSLEWELLPADAVSTAFYRNPRGHIEAGRPFSLNSYFEEMTPGIFETVLIEPEFSAVYMFTVSGMGGEKIMSLYDVLDSTREVRYVVADEGVDDVRVALYTQTDGSVAIKTI